MTNANTMELGLIVKDAKVVVSSKVVAELFEKDHDRVLKDIDEVVRKCTSDFGRANFDFVYKTLPNGVQIQSQRVEILMTRDGFTFLVMGYTGERAMRFKEAYINAFNMMERKLASGELALAKFNIPRDLGEALILAGNIELERKRLEYRLENAKAKIEHDAPKLATFDAHYPNGKYTPLTAFARTLDGVNTMLIKKSLARCGYLYQTPNTGKYRVYAQYRGIDNLFVEKHDEMYDQYQIYVTNKGMQVITKLYNAEKLFMLKRFAA